jgi:hypothetical protein
MIERYDTMVEDMITMLGELPTTVNCVDAGACGGDHVACAGVPPFGDSAPETMSIEDDYLASTTIDDLTRIIVHEAAHTKGWNHYPNFNDIAYPWSVPEQAGTCMKAFDPSGWPRLQPFGDTELSPVGGGGGQPFELRCPSGARVTGVTADSSTYMNRIKLRCSDGTFTASAGEYKDSTRTINHQCLSGDSLIGTSGYSDGMVRGLTAFCADDTDLANDVTNPTVTALWLGGSYTGTYASRVCPTGMAVVGAVGRSGARIDQLRWLCQDVDGAVLPNPHASYLRGIRRGNAKLGDCAGNGAIRALYGHASVEIDQLGAECYPTMPDAGGLPVVQASNATRHGLDFNGGTGGAVFNKPCPWDHVLVGLRVRSGNRLDAIGGICAPSTDWASGITSTASFTTMAGGTGGTYEALYCPNREFLVGLESWSDYTAGLDATTIHAVRMRCRRLDL